VMSTPTCTSLLVTMLACVLAGCSPAQTYPTLEQHGISLQPGDLESYGISFITPSATTGQEEEKQAVALVFSDAMQKERSGIRVVPLAETLSAVNKAGLADRYSHMYSDYRDTGLFNREILQQIGQVTNVRYVAQIKVQGFEQTGKDRLTIFGLRIIETKASSVRLFFQIWDTRDGTVTWEATQELHVAYDTITEEPLTFQEVVGRAAQELVSKLP
jgi:hypothetical protein